MSNTGEANRLMTEQLRNNGEERAIGALNTQELSKDAREFAALQRQREEERQISLGMEQKGRSALGADKPKKKMKVVRRKITKVSSAGAECRSMCLLFFGVFQPTLLFRQGQTAHSLSPSNLLLIVRKWKMS